MSSYADEKWQGKLKQYCHDNNHRQLEKELFERASGEATLRPGLSTLKCFDDHGELFLEQLMALACSNGHLESVQVLVGALSKEQLNGNYKWNIPPFTGNSWTLLHISARYGSARLAQLLLTHGCMIDAKGGFYGMTATYVASWSGHEKVVAMLLQHGADVNAAIKNGFTSIYVASQNGHEKVVALLLQHGAEVNAVTKYGVSALDKASTGGHHECVSVLMEHMSKMYSYDKMMEIVEPGSEKARKNYNPRCLNYIEKFLYSKSLGSESEAATDISSRSGQIGLKRKCADVMTASQQDTGDIRDLFQSEEYRLVRMNLITYMDVEERHSAEGFSLITSRQLDHLSTVVGRRNHNRELFHMMEAGGPASIRKFSATVLDSMGPNFVKYKATLDALLAKVAKQ